MKLSEQWEIIYNTLKNHYKDGRHFADPEHVRNGFIALYDEVEQLEVKVERLQEYAYHKTECKFMMPHFGNPQKCTCGYAALEAGDSDVAG